MANTEQQGLGFRRRVGCALANPFEGVTEHIFQFFIRPGSLVNDPQAQGFLAVNP